MSDDVIIILSFSAFAYGLGIVSSNLLNTPIFNGWVLIIIGIIGVAVFCFKSMILPKFENKKE